jgi:hypothetical protein
VKHGRGRSRCTNISRHGRSVGHNVGEADKVPCWENDVASIVPLSKVAQKVELMANDVKLEGVGNYVSWSRRALLTLRTKGLEGCVIGEVTEATYQGSGKRRKVECY